MMFIFNKFCYIKKIYYPRSKSY